MAPASGQAVLGVEKSGIRLRLLGGFRLADNGESLQPGTREQRLVAYLALRAGGTRSEVAGTLWPSIVESRAHGCLRTALWRLGRLGQGIVDTSTSRLSLGGTVWSDVGELDGWITGRNGAGTLSTDALLSGDLLPDWDDEWVMLERERLRQIRLHGLEDAAQQRSEQRRYAEALDLGLAAIRAEPLRETAHRTVILIHLAEGNIGEAMRQYRALASLLWTELSAQPSAPLRRLVRDELARARGANSGQPLP